MATGNSQLHVRPVTHEDKAGLANLIHFESHVHRHLDWRSPLEWLGRNPFLVAEKQGRIVAALALPPAPPDIAWIRLFAAASIVPIEIAWGTLWQAALAEIAALPEVQVIAAIPLQRWFSTHLENNGFEAVHKVVLLKWEGGDHPGPTSDPNVMVRPMVDKDLQDVLAIDKAAFESIWQISMDCLERAYFQAIVATVAEYGGVVAGYQISTPTPLGAHLARLATLPKFQGHGIGSTLVRALLEEFHARGISHVSVNTQEHNLASLAIYHKAGFRRTGEEYPVYQFRIAARTHQK